MCIYIYIYIHNYKTITINGSININNDTGTRGSAGVAWSAPERPERQAGGGNAGRPRPRILVLLDPLACIWVV